MQNSTKFPQIFQGNKQQKQGQKQNGNRFRICNCPCIVQIQQNQKIIQLQRQYTKTIQMQNLRRNQQRLSLQTLIIHLRLQLQQPRNQIKQLESRVQHYKAKINNLCQNNKNLESYIEKQNSHLTLLQDELIRIKNMNEKLLGQKKQDYQHANEFKNKMNSMYEQFYEKSSTKQIRQKANHTSKANQKNNFKSNESNMKSNDLNENQNVDNFNSSYNIRDIIENINKKWQLYAQKLQKDHEINRKNVQTSYIKQIQRFQAQILIDNCDLNHKNDQIKKITQLNKGFQQQIQNLKLQITENQKSQINQFKIDQKQSKITKLQFQLIQKQKKYTQSLNLQRSKFQTLNNKLLTVSNQLKTLKQKIDEKTRKIFYAQTQTYEKYEKLSQKEDQIQKLEKKIINLSQKVKQYQNECFKLISKNESLQKINSIYKQNIFQHQFQLSKLSSQSFIKTSQKFLSITSVTSISDKKKEQQFDNKRALLLSTQMIQQLKNKLSKLQVQVKQKNYQIQTLEQVNSKLRKLKIQSINDIFKPMTPKKQVNQSRRSFAIQMNQYRRGSVMMKGQKANKLSNQSSQVSLDSNGRTLFNSPNNSYNRSSLRKPSIMNYQAPIDYKKTQHYPQGVTFGNNNESSYIWSNSRNEMISQTAKSIQQSIKSVQSSDSSSKDNILELLRNKFQSIQQQQFQDGTPYLKKYDRSNTQQDEYKQEETKEEISIYQNQPVTLTK